MKRDDIQMNVSASKITIIQLLMIFALTNGLIDHVIINPMLLDSSGRDAWITVLVTGGMFIVWCLLLSWMIRKSGQQKWQKWISEKTHPLVSWILMIPVCVVLYVIGATTVIHTVKWNTTNYLPASPALVLTLTLVAICFLITIWGLRVIAVTAGVLFPIVSLLGVFVSVFNHSEKDYRLLTPILEHGWAPVLDGILYASSGFIEVIFILMLQHRLSEKIKTWHVFAYSLFIIVIMLGPIVGAITEFGPKEASNQMTPPYEQWRLVKVGEYIEHVDFFSIFQWMSGACIRISLAAYLITDTLRLTGRVRKWATAIIMASYIFVGIIPTNDNTYYKWMYAFFLPISFGILFAVTITWMVITLFAKPSKPFRKGEPQ
ncbi:spore germination protein (amino acid permease) [Paenibacillus catalpae]|uniref:Spore germination protein (Amino acid permease) n=1 Tax=Paenibacillus catalpae TaxID=1045775 RepID=A0A1I2GMK5_9BACL|nr:endospore germination permease [Paenibacillus catalpae]SFF19164.1 spore germination protein (amino acid permease) [Paenibacillus catalpae]